MEGDYGEMENKAAVYDRVSGRFHTLLDSDNEKVKEIFKYCRLDLLWCMKIVQRGNYMVTVKMQIFLAWFIDHICVIPRTIHMKQKLFKSSTSIWQVCKSNHYQKWMSGLTFVSFSFRVSQAPALQL